MGFPSVATVGTATASESSASFSVPSAQFGTISSGDLLLIFVAHDDTATIAYGGGPSFTQIDSGAGASNACQGEVWARIGTGTESGSTLFTSTNDQDVVAIPIRISVGTHTVVTLATDITLGTAATGTSANPDPPNCNPGVAKDYLWLCYLAADDDDDTANYEPASYSKVAQAESAASLSSCLVAIASRELNATAENPGAMAMAATEEWRAQTLAIPGTVNSGANSDPMGMMGFPGV